MIQPSLHERILFLILFAASVYGFWRRLSPAVATIRGSKKDADFEWRPADRRF